MIKVGQHHGTNTMKQFSITNAELEPTRYWGNVPLFNIQDGIKLINFCEKHNIAVLGIEGFKIINDKRVPDLDYIADFSALMMVSGDNFPSVSRISALKFLNTIGNEEILIEFELATI